MALANVTLDDKFDLGKGRIYATGYQAIVDAIEAASHYSAQNEQALQNSTTIGMVDTGEEEL